MVEQTKAKYIKRRTEKVPSNSMTGRVMLEYAQGVRKLSVERKSKGWMQTRKA